MKINKKDLQKIIRDVILEVTDFGDFSLDSSIKKGFTSGKVGGGGSSSNSKSSAEKFLKDVDLGNVRALFVGDSQTYYPGVSYANQLLKSNDISGKNISKNGAPLKKIKEFLRSGMMKDNYDVITIMGGGNDSHSSNPSYSLYDEMYDVVKRSNALLVAITNPTKKNLPEAKRKKYPSNEKLANHVRLNSIPDIMIDANRKFSSENYFNKDLVHINSKAHKELAAMWRGLVFEKLKNKVS